MTDAAVLAQEAAEARGQMYRFLSAAYLRPPEPALLRLLGDGAVLDQLSGLLGEAAVAELRPLADRGAAEDILASLRQEYMDLFAVPTGRYLTPFEDVYRGANGDGVPRLGPLLGPRAVAVRRLYRQAGAEMERACSELPTHVGVELAFMSFLCEQEAAALRAGAAGDPEAGTAAAYRQLQLRFLREHLNGWVPELCRAIRARTRGPFYRAIARITQAFLATDSAAPALEPEPGAAARPWSS